MTWLLENSARLEGYRRGDRAVLAEVYQTYAMPLARAVASGFSGQRQSGGYRIVGVSSPFDLDDIVQETFLRAFADRARMGFDGVQPFSRYLHAIARNLVIDRGRRAGRRPEQLEASDVIDANAAHAPQLDTPEPESDLFVSELQALYTAFLATLSDDERLLWQLRVELEQPRRLVQERTGLSAMQVRTRERRMRGDLVRRLEEGGYVTAGAAFAVQVLLVVVL